MTSKKTKYASLLGVGLLAISLVACANENEQYQTLGDSGLKTPEETFAGTSTENKCREYELQKDGSYKCDDDDVAGASGGTSVVPLFFFNGHTYSSHSAMVSSSDYKKNNLVNGTKYTSKTKDSTKNSNSKNSSKNSGSNNVKSGSTSSGKSGGFGSGGKGSSGGS